MKRRTLLKGVATAAAGGVLAGCLEEPADPGAPGTDDADGGDGAGDDPDGDGTDGDDDVPFDLDESPPTGSSTQTIVTRETTCGETDRATVSWSEDSIVVSGWITASNPCHEAVVDGVEVEDDVATVSIGIRGDEEEVCIQCLGEINYEATIRFDDRPPAEVVVRHVGMEELDEVTRETVD